MLYDFLSNYGKIPAYIIILLFLMWWMSNFIFLGRLARTEALIKRIDNGKKLRSFDLEQAKASSNIEGLNYLFSLPDEKTHPRHFQDPFFRKWIKETKALKKSYSRISLIIITLMLLVFVGRVYVVQVERNKKESKSNKVENNSAAETIMIKRT